jgi:hypothetical protein
MTITKATFEKSLANRQVTLDELEDATPRVMQRLRGADANDDGIIAGADEVRAAFRALDDFDRNGSRNSLGETRSESRGHDAAQEMMRLARKAPPLPQAPSTDDAPPTDATPGNMQGSPDVRADRSLSTYQGGVGAIRVAEDSNGRAGAVQFKAAMNVDTDGGSSAESRSDRYYQSQTSMKLGGRYLDADRLPFIVLPPGLVRETGAKLGDLVHVEKDGKSMYAIYGDGGPSGKIGEASMYMTKFFDPRSGPNRAATGTYTYTVLPGTGAAAGIRNGGHAVPPNDTQKRGAAAFAAARERGLL